MSHPPDGKFGPRIAVDIAGGWVSFLFKKWYRIQYIVIVKNHACPITPEVTLVDNFRGQYFKKVAVQLLPLRH